MEKKSKRYQGALKFQDKSKSYDLKEAVEVLKKMPPAKFNESLELSFHLNVDPKNSDQMVRGTVTLPHGTGKTVRVAVFCKGDTEKAAREAGADFVGAEDLIAKVNSGWLDFDCAIATPEMMRDLSKLGKILGPKGLMPSPKTGTVTPDVANAIKDVRRGKVEFKVDKQSGIHLAVGKMSFSQDELCENASKVIEALQSAKPASVKGKFFKSAFISTTMNPGLRLAL